MYLKVSLVSTCLLRASRVLYLKVSFVSILGPSLGTSSTFRELLPEF